MNNNNRFCVFCGELPERKNREHVLPQWLIKMTGNPKRVVNFGTNYKTGKTIKFDFSNFVVPSCEKCNIKYSDIEKRAKEYTERLLQRDALTSLEYIDFMDWLDKVRIGVWIAYYFIQKNPVGIKPHFHINTRISTTDRMIAIYPIKSNEKGLNIVGAESLIFQTQPSCFGLKINNILILNMSSDYLFSARCGFPYPKIHQTYIDTENAGMMEVGEFDITHDIKHPLIEKKIIKPSVHLYQPIMLKDNKNIYQSGFVGNYSIFDSFLAKHTLSPYPNGKGILFFQHPEKVEPLFDIDAPIHFQEVIGIDSKPMFELMSQIYEFQNHICEQGKFKATNYQLIEQQNETRKVLLKLNQEMIHYLKDKVTS